MVVGYWAHLRMKFEEAMKFLPIEKAKNSSAVQGLAYCTLLFGLEEDFAGLTPEERYRLYCQNSCFLLFFALYVKIRPRYFDFLPFFLRCG